MNNGAETLIMNEIEKTKDDTREKTDKIDFKMVTFSLGGKDYGIDIMKIKEIAKYGGYTYVPNSPSFVRGVYNLRGDIISVIDLRAMFNLAIEERQESFENGLILRLDDNVLGIVVDHIDKVVGISSERIQPPHPIFGDVNIKYISGVVENDNRLYIILNVEKIFTKESRKAETRVEPETVESLTLAVPEAAAEREPDKAFIAETLRTFKSFHVSEVNAGWLERRFPQWKAMRSGDDLQVKSASEADEFLEAFYSPDTGKFWSSEYAEAFAELLADPAGNIVNVWNPGCGKGFETYSLASIMNGRYSKRMLKIWANDSDLLAISTAPNLVFDDEEVPEYLRPHTVNGKNGLGFQSGFKDKIFFEYHDILNAGTLPELDVIVARDLVSFLNPADQRKLLDEFYEKLKPSGLLFLGANEELADPSRWKKTEKNGIAAYAKI